MVEADPIEAVAGTSLRPASITRVTPPSVTVRYETVADDAGRVCEVLGLEIERLLRISFGPVRLGDLRPGESRPLTAGELRAVDALLRMPTLPRDDRFDDD